MKTIFNAVVVMSLIGVLGVIALSKVGNTTVAINTVATSTPEVVETFEWINDEDAINAAQAMYERKKLESEREANNGAIADIDKQISELNSQKEAIKQENIRLSKEIGDY